VVKISVLYPYSEGKAFDMDYYCKKHMAMVKEVLGSACRGVGVDQGIAGGAPGSPPAYVAMGHIYCDSFEAFQTALGPNATKFADDMPNYTTIDPIMQISEVKM